MMSIPDERHRSESEDEAAADAGVVLNTVVVHRSSLPWGSQAMKYKQMLSKVLSISRQGFHMIDDALGIYKGAIKVVGLD